MLRPQALVERLNARADIDGILVQVPEAEALEVVQLAGRGRSGTGSTGIGMDVARRTAENAGGSIAPATAGDSAGSTCLSPLPFGTFEAPPNQSLLFSAQTVSSNGHNSSSGGDLSDAIVARVGDVYVP